MCDDGAEEAEEGGTSFSHFSFLARRRRRRRDVVDNREVSREQREFEDTAQVRLKLVHI